MARATGVTRDPETPEKVIKAVTKQASGQGALRYKQGASGRQAPTPKIPALPLEALITGAADAYLSGLRSAFGLIKVKH